MILKPGIKQAIYTFGVQMNMFSLGTASAYAGTLGPALSEPGSGFHIDLKMVSLIASMPGWSGFLPIILLGPLMHFAGRKTANICLSVPIFCGWILTYFAAEYNSISMLLAGRFLHGLPMGAAYFISVCIAEFSDPKNRNNLLGFKPITAVLGVALMHTMAYYLHWKHMALVGAIPPALGFLITLFWPETPEWLVSRARYEEAETVFYSLRGYSKEGEHELMQMIECEKDRRKFLSDNQRRFAFWKTFKSPILWRPIAILFFALLVPVMGGRHYLVSYSVHLGAQLSGDKTKGYFYTVLSNGIAIPGAVLNLYLLKRFSRRGVLLGTGFVGSVMLAVACAMLYIRTIYPSEALSYSILGVFAVYYFLANCGFYPVSYILMGEIFPLEYRALGSLIDGLLSALGMALVSAFLPWLEIAMGTYGVLLIFGCIMLISLIYLYYHLPETKNRSLHDVGDYFRGKSPKIRRVGEFAFNADENRSILEVDK
ncbi:facilitated trehalose transporter Tret1-like [Choristoneura fumiferana]|uniref:facilitated trehalose transporter Tret1-like n=1 Tax=Choristoneura fumiferana TaxID=7141 RepID=UPI003D15BE06